MTSISQDIARAALASRALGRCWRRTQRNYALIDDDNSDRSDGDNSDDEDKRKRRHKSNKRHKRRRRRQRDDDAVVERRRGDNDNDIDIDNDNDNDNAIVGDEVVWSFVDDDKTFEYSEVEVLDVAMCQFAAALLRQVRPELVQGLDEMKRRVDDDVDDDDNRKHKSAHRRRH